MIGAIITAAGSSVRMGGDKKEFRPSGSFDTDGSPLSVLGAAIRPFFDHPHISNIVVTIPEGEAPRARSLLPVRFFAKGAKGIIFIAGGATRRESVFRALESLKDTDISKVLIHDGARPWLTPELLDRVITALDTHDAVVPVLQITETPKELDGEGHIIRHLERARTVLAQTPQGFVYPAILDAHREEARLVAKGREDNSTDDAELWGSYCGAVQAIPGIPQNRKITFPADLPA